MKKIFKIPFLLLFILLSSYTFAAIEPVNVRLQGSEVVVNNGTSTTLEVKDNKFWLVEMGAWQNNFTIQSVQNKVILGIDESDISFNQGLSYAYRVTGDVTYKKLENGLLVDYSLSDVSLEIDYNPARGTIYKDRQVISFTDGLSVTIKITNLEENTGNGWTPINTLPSFVFVESEIITERYYNFSANVPPPINMQMGIGNGELKVTWPYVEGAEEYELEWAWVNSYSGDINSNLPVLLSPNAVSFNFAENATRVRTRGMNSYQIPLIYGDGFIVVRYRAIGRGGENFQIPIEGVWNYSTNSDFVSNAPNYIQVSAHENNNINYGAGVSFIENGVRSVGVTYMDGVLKPRQSQAKLNSQDNIIVGSTIYDHYGRPAIGVMSTPVNQNTLGYVDNLNMLNSTTVYDKSAFDQDNNSTVCGGNSSLPPMDQNNSAGAANYYSEANTNKEGYNAYLPNAEGYPFVQVKYDNDPTGRIKKVGGVGPNHQLGNTTIGQNTNGAHYTEYFYTTPDDYEIYKLFGNEGSTSQNYTKIITKDVHGQLSVALTDPMGRTVATYMMGAAPTNLSAIEGNLYPGLTPETKDFMMYNTTNEVDGIVEVSTPVFVSEAGETWTFNYDFTGVNFTSCLPPNICFDCAYTIEIAIIPDEPCNLTNNPSAHITDLSGTAVDDVNGEVHMSFDVGTINENDYNIDCNTYTFSGINPGDETFALIFPKLGTYQVVKTLKVSQAPINYYWGQYLENNTCLLTYEDFLENALSSIDPDACTEYEPCEYNFLLENGTFDVYVANNPGATQQEYDDLRQSYIDNCGQSSPCETMYPGMLSDFKIGGQYALPSSSNDPTSIFSSSLSTLLSYMPASGLYPDGTQIMVDTDGNGSLDKSILDPTLTLSEFETGYQNIWAEYFISMHPEYCFYNFCDTHSDIYNFEHLMNTTQTYAEACSLGLFSAYSTYNVSGCDAAGTNSTDPLFAYFTSASTQANTDMQAIITQTYPNNGNNYDIFQMAAILSGDGPNDFGNSTCNLELQWQNFKALYLSIRFQIIEILQKDNCSDATTNCIQDPNCTTTPWDTKVPRYIDFETGLGFDLNSNPDWNALGNQNNNTIESNCLSQCQNMADTWMADLAGCVIYLPQGETWVTGQPTYDAVEAALISVCSGGCGAEWPFLAQQNPNYDPNATNPVEYGSFEDVITSLLGPETAECSHLSIFNPSPSAGGTSMVQTLNDCGCNQLLSSIDLADFEATYGFTPLNYESEKCNCDSYDVDASGAIDGGEIATLEAASVFTPNYYSCTSNCITCSKITTYINDFKAEFGITYADDPLLFTAYVNEQTSGVYNYDQLIDFYEECQQGLSNVTVCPKLEDFLEFFDRLTQYDLTTSGTYNNITLPELFYSTILENCGVDESMVYNYTPSIVSPGKLKIQYPFTSASYCTGKCDIFIEIIGNYGGYATAQEYFQNIESFDYIDYQNNNYAVVTVNNPSGVGTFTGTVDITNSCGFTCYTSVNQICSGDPEPGDEFSCMDELITNAELSATTQYEQYLDEQYAIFKSNYISTCTQITDETFNASYSNNKYQYTLLYYDQSGNLVKTVPPKGVAALGLLTDAQAQDAKTYAVTNGILGVEYIRDYPYETHYKHNALNQVETVTTPDGGTSHYWYDNLGRLVVSQNAKQAEFNTGNITGDYGNGTNMKAYSYTRYDELGRVIEVGEIIHPTTMTKVIAKDPIQLEYWLGGTIFGGQTVSYATRNNVTQIYYDEAFSAAAEAEFGDGGYGHTRNRITAITVIEGYFTPNSSSTDYPAYNYANHYRYDIHGNVQAYLQEIPELDTYHNRFRKVDYDYDLISGNPNYIYYQKGKPDQYIHHYIYDQDNRLKEVYTSNDGQIWDRDVNYEYREDGYLARTELGEMKVQGMDYAYTLHGWLKTLNSGVLNADYDMGKDGEQNPSVEYSNIENKVHGLFAQDALAYTIGYYEGDYSAIGNNLIGSNNMQLNTAGSAFETDKKDLYNGNITSLITNLTGTDGTKLNVHANTYHYDQLHRFKEMHVFSSTDITANNNLNTAIRSNINTSGLGDYEVKVDYDMNGNITNLIRMSFNETGVHDNKMDEFTYDYSYTTTDPVTSATEPTNKLNYVTDNVTNTGSLDYGDIQNNQTSGNYTYHADGSLKSDADEGIEYIDWYPSGKVKYIKRVVTSNQSDVYFEYGPTGIRTLKVAIPKIADPNNAGQYINETSNNWTYTYYGTDANGITLAIYSLDLTEGQEKLSKIESMIYGGSRLGIETANIEVSATYDPITVCHTDGLQSAVIEIGSQTITASPYNSYIYSNLRLTIDGLELAYINTNNYSTTLDYANALINRINEIHPELTTTLYDLGNGTTYNIEIKEDVAGALSGGIDINTYEFPLFYDPVQQGYTYSPNNNNITSYPQSILRAPTAGACYSDRQLGTKMYELSNHLGNVMEVITDRKIGKDAGTYDINGNFVSANLDGVADYYLADIVSYSDYYPFGMQMPGRKSNEEAYRYAFNGMETDKEVSGGGNSYTTQFRQYDPRLGRWKSLDPLAGKFPAMSPFAAFNNNPIFFVDPLGLEGEGTGNDKKRKRKRKRKRKNKKGNGFWKKKNKNGGLSDEDADTKKLPEVTINVPASDEEIEEINSRRREKGTPSIQFENSLSDAQQKILLDRFNRMSMNKSSIAWSEGTKQLYRDIYYGTDNYDKYLSAYNPTFGAPFANSWSAGAMGWKDGSIGKDWQRIAAIGVGGTIATVYLIPMIAEIGAEVVVLAAPEVYSIAKAVYKYNKLGTAAAITNVVFQTGNKGISNVDWSTPIALITFQGPYGFLGVATMDAAVDVSFNKVQFFYSKKTSQILIDLGTGLMFGLPVNQFGKISPNHFTIFYDAAVNGIIIGVNKANE